MVGVVRKSNRKRSLPTGGVTMRRATPTNCAANGCGNEDPFFQTREWLELRYQTLEASNGMCGCCGNKHSASNPLQVDHIKPRSKFPELALTLSNLQVLCRRCNLGKGNKSETDWRITVSSALKIQNNLEPEIRFRLQQLSWISLNGDSKQIRSSAQKEHQKLWREVEMEFVKGRKACRAIARPTVYRQSTSCCCFASARLT
jgi:HNH endonuclease